MSDGYHELLDATIGHLQDLKSHGVKFLPVKPETLTALAAPPRAQAAKSLTPKPVAPIAPNKAPKNIICARLWPESLAVFVLHR